MINPQATDFVPVKIKLNQLRSNSSKFITDTAPKLLRYVLTDESKLDGGSQIKLNDVENV